MKHLNNKFIKIPLDYLYVVLFKDIMQLYLLMDKQEQEKLLQWKDLNIRCTIKNEVLFQEQSKIFLDIYKAVNNKM